jgi:hypothetical protein
MKFLICLLPFLGITSVLQGQSTRALPHVLPFTPAHYSKTRDLIYVLEHSPDKTAYFKALDTRFGRIVKQFKIDSLVQARALSPSEQYLYYVVPAPYRVKRINLDDYKDETIWTLAENDYMRVIASIPGKQERQLLCWGNGYKVSLGLLEGTQISRVTTFNEVFFTNFYVQNDSITWATVGQSGIIVRLAIRSSNIVIKDTLQNYIGFPGSFKIVNDTLFSVNEMVADISTGALKVLKPEESRQFSFREMIVPQNSPFYYHITSNWGFFDISKFLRKDFTLIDTRRSNRTISIDSYLYAEFLGQDNFYIGAQESAYLSRRCNVKVPSPVIKEGLEVYACLTLDSTVILSAQHQVPEYIWSNGVTTSSQTLRNSGGFRLQYGDTDGCLSPWSELTTVQYYNPTLPPWVNGSREEQNILSCLNQETSLNASSAHDKFEWSNGVIAPTLKAKKAGTYRVRGIDSRGCPSLWSKNINIRQLPDSIPTRPVIRSRENKFDYCQNETAELILPTGYAYYEWNQQLHRTSSWNVYSNTQMVARIGNDLRCMSLYSFPVQVNFNPVPRRPVIQRSGKILATNNGEERHFWYLNGQLIENENGQFLNIPKNGIYTVKTQAKGCESALSETFAVQDLTTSNRNIQQTIFPLQAFPNPFVDKISLSGLPPQSEYQMYNVLGKVVKNGFSNSLGEIDASELPAGHYVLSARTRQQNIGIVQLIKH